MNASVHDELQGDTDQSSVPSTKRGNLVSSRVKMFDQRPPPGAVSLLRENFAPHPTTSPRKVYRSRPQDSFDSPPRREETYGVIEARQGPSDSRHSGNSSLKPENGRNTNSKRNTDDAGYVGSTLVESGINHYAHGEYEKALKAFNTALKTQRVSIGDEDICIALTLGNLGAVYLQQRDLDKAEALLLESLQMKRRLKPTMVVADTLNNIGNCYNLRGNNERSLEYYREALEDLRTKNGRREDIANALFNMGRLEFQQRDWDAARNMLTEAWRMTRDIHGPNHVFVAQTLDLIGLVQLSTNDLDAAMISFTKVIWVLRYVRLHQLERPKEDYYLECSCLRSHSRVPFHFFTFYKALGIYRRLHGPLHLDVANSLFHVGMVREAKGELADAWESYTTTRDLYSRLGTDSDHPGFTTVRQSISKVEKAIARENQERLVEKRNEARAAAAATAAAAAASTARPSSPVSEKAREKHERLIARHRQARNAKSISPKSRDKK